LVGGAEPQYNEPESCDIAQHALIALRDIGPLSDAVGDTLLDLANTTVDRKHFTIHIKFAP
jgi:hypothetical protein